MCFSPGTTLDHDAAIFLSVLLGCMIIGCILTNTRLVWLGANGSSRFNRNLQLSPYLLSCCCSDTIIVCIFGPVLCILYTQSWTVSDAVCAFLDVLFLALFWITTISLLLYNLDRHCLLIQRRYYIGAFGKQKRNTINLVATWITPAVFSLPYLQIRTSLHEKRMPMAFRLAPNILYFVFAVVILYAVPITIISASLMKILLYLKVKSRHFQNQEEASNIPIIPGIIHEDIQTYKGLLASSAIYIFTSLPWIILQFIKSLALSSGVSSMHETVLITILIMGISIKTIVYVTCCSFLRKRFFVNVFRDSTYNFELPPSPAVLSNTAAV